MSRKLRVITGVTIIVIIILVYVGFNVLSLNERSLDTISLEVRGDSMSPTLNDGDIVDVVGNNYTLSRGDIVAIKFNTGDDFYIKRIIATGGDRVIFGEDNTVYVNDEALEEEYLSSQDYAYGDDLVLLITQLEYYDNVVLNERLVVMGDNRAQSRDSRNWGLVHKQAVVGKVLME